MKMNFQIKRSKGSGQNYYTTSGPTVMNEGDSFCLYPPPPTLVQRPLLSFTAPLPWKTHGVLYSTPPLEMETHGVSYSPTFPLNGDPWCPL